MTRRILEDALSRNAFGTASIEGNPLTLTDVESLLAVAPTPDRVTVPDEREILNYAAFVRSLDGIRVSPNATLLSVKEGVLVAGRYLAPELAGPVVVWLRERAPLLVGTVVAASVVAVPFAMRKR